MYRIYNVETIVSDIKPELVLTEDSNSGYQFFKALCEKNDLECFSCEGKSNIFSMVANYQKQVVLIIADGAAFGPEMEKIIKLMQVKKNINLYLPESFEWVVLQSGVINDYEIKDILDVPYEYIDSREYLSWERFFTRILIDKTKDTYLSYSKKILNPSYQQEYVVDKVLKVMQKINFVWKNK